MDVKNEIIEFINSEENNGALLITGKWGCGKSYLVKNIVKEFNENNEYAIAVISLFGIDSVAMLNERIKDEYLELNSGLLGKTARKAYKVLRKLANESSKITAAALPESVAASAISTGVSSVISFDPLGFISVKNTVGINDKKRKFALVFDDFERSNIKIKQLLGVINECAENKQIKTILIADEDKIEGDEYTEFKEKLISRTVKINPQHSNTIHSIITNYSEKEADYKQFLLEYEHCLQGAFFHSDYNNLRTLKSCIFDFMRVYKTWKDSQIPMDDIESVFYKFCAMTYETKAGVYVKAGALGYKIHGKGDNNEERESNRQKIVDKYLPETFDHVFTSLSRWIVDGDWDEEKFLSDIKNRYVKEDISHEQKFVHYHFWDLQQEDIDIGLPTLVDKAYKGEATRDELIALLQKVHALKTHNIPLPCEINYLKIEEGFNARRLKIRNGDIEEPMRRTFSELTSLDPEAIDLYKKIESMDEQIYAWSNRNLFIDFLKGEGKITHYDLKNKYIDSFDDELFELFFSVYDKALNGEKRELCWVLTGMNFNNNRYSDKKDKAITIKNFNLLINEIDNEINTNKDQMSVAIAKAFKSLLEEKITQLDKAQE